MDGMAFFFIFFFILNVYNLKKINHFYINRCFKGFILQKVAKAHKTYSGSNVRMFQQEAELSEPTCDMIDR